MLQLYFLLLYVFVRGLPVQPVLRLQIRKEKIKKGRVGKQYEENHFLRNSAFRVGVRDRDDLSYARRIFRIFAFHGVSARVRGVDAPARQAELPRLSARVYRKLYPVVHIQRGAVLGSVAVRDLFRLASARQRIAVEDKDQPLARVRDQGAVVRRDDVSRLAVRVRHDDEYPVADERERVLDHSRGRLGVFRGVRLLNV